MADYFENIISLEKIPGKPFSLTDAALFQSENFTDNYNIKSSELWYEGNKNTGKGKNLDNKIMLEKGALRDIIETTKNLTPEETIAKLELYQGITLGKDILNKSGKDALNMFEMIALYQRSIQHLTTLKIKVDARFGPRTFEKLMKTQKEVLKFEGKAIDGIPGPKTTKAIIKALHIALDTTKNQDTNTAYNKLMKEVSDKKEESDMQEYGKGIVSGLQGKIGTDTTALAKELGKNMTKTFFSGKDKYNIDYAYVTEGNIVSVWGEINTTNKNKTRPLVLMEGGKVIYVGELSQDNKLTDKMGVWPVGKNRKDYGYMPTIPQVNIIKTK